MPNDERNGLIILIAFLLVTSVLWALTTNGGQSFGNIYMNMISNVDTPRPAAIEAQYAAVEQEENVYSVIGAVADVVSLVTLLSIFVYTLRRRHLPLGWCILLFIVGSVSGSLFYVAQSIYAHLSTIPVTVEAYDMRSSMVAGTVLIGLFGIIGAIFALIGLASLVGALIRRRRTA